MFNEMNEDKSETEIQAKLQRDSTIDENGSINIADEEKNSKGIQKDDEIGKTDEIEDKREKRRAYMREYMRNYNKKKIKILKDEDKDDKALQKKENAETKETQMVKEYKKKDSNYIYSIIIAIVGITITGVIIYMFFFRNKNDTVIVR